MEIMDDGAHAGQRDVMTRVKRIPRFLFWAGLESDVREYIDKYEVCQATKAPGDFEPAVSSGEHGLGHPFCCDSS